MCIEPDWQAFGRSKATAVADLARLLMQLGCWSQKQGLQGQESVCLARGAEAILRAVQNAGEAFVCSAGTLDAVACLGHCLLQAVGDPRRHWVHSDMRRRVRQAFVPLGEKGLRGKAGLLLQGAPDAPQRACSAVWLTQTFLQAHYDPEGATNSLNPV
jgi:hypothetical protein